MNVNMWDKNKNYSVKEEWGDNLEGEKMKEWMKEEVMERRIDG